MLDNHRARYSDSIYVGHSIFERLNQYTFVFYDLTAIYNEIFSTNKYMNGHGNNPVDDLDNINP